MNRRSFFRNLVLGVAALPMAVKALGKSPLVQYGAPRLWVSEPKQKIWMCSNPVGEYSINPAWESAPYSVSCWTMDGKGVWRHEERRGFQYKLDANPLRFTPKQLGDAIAERLVLL